VSYDTALSEVMPGFAPKGASADDLRAVTLGAIAGQIGAVVREAPQPCSADESACNLTTQEILPAINALPLLWTPGVRPAYSNLGFSLLGRALESPELSYEAWVETKILEPLGMNHSGFDWTDDVYSNLATGAEPDHAVTHLGWTAPNGEMFSTASDMESFLNNFITGSFEQGSVLPQWRKNEWFHKTAALLPDGISGYGMPWELQFSEARVGPGRWLRTKAGNIDQFGSQIAVDPTTGLAMWLATNRGDYQAAELADAVNGVIFPAFDVSLGDFVEQGHTLPARAGDMEGIYFAYVPSVSANMTVSIVAGPNKLECLFVWGESKFPGTLLPDPVDDATATLSISTKLPLSCLVVTELAWDGEPVNFNFADETLTMPGLLSATFIKQ